MSRLLSTLAGLMVLSAAGALYAVKHDTRRIEVEVQTRERALEKAEGDIAVLKAERAYLARPERIERFARAQGLEPIREQQYARLAESAEDAIAKVLAAPEVDPEAGPTIAPRETEAP
jgi:cell division protein FtsL